MIAQRNAHFLASAALLASSACTFVLDELDVTCKSQDDCRALNQHHQLDDGEDGDCEIYQCRPDGRGCEKRPRDLDEDKVPDEKTCADHLSPPLDCDDGNPSISPNATESCDAQDNDCDYWIDEDQLNASTLDELRVSADLAPVDFVSYQRAEPWLAALTSREGANAATTRWYEADRVQQVSRLSPTSETACGGSCVFYEMAVAADAEVVLALGIDVEGCTSGRLRVGARKIADSSKPLNWRGSVTEGDSKTFLGGVDTCVGARSPSLALLSSKGAGQALGLFRAGRLQEGQQTAPLVALGLRLGDALIEPTNGGLSEALDAPELRGHDAASVRAFEGAPSGYFVGYDSEHGVELAFVPKWEGRSLLNGVKRRRIAREQGVRQVALAFDPRTDSSVQAASGLAVAWRAREQGQEVIRFARLSFSPQTTAGFAVVGKILSLRLADRIIEGPVVSYAAAGIRARDDLPGGWFVSWVEQNGQSDQLLAVRVAESSGESFEEPFVIAQETRIEHLFAFERAPGVRIDAAIEYAFVSNASPQHLNIGALSCRVRE
jgi:hypothetical protein